MDAVSIAPTPGTRSKSFSYTNLSLSQNDAHLQYQSLVISSTLAPSSRGEDRVNVGGAAHHAKALNLTADEILSRLNRELEEVLPAGIESVDPSEVTPEATAERVVNSIVGLFEIFSKSHTELSDEERVTRFFEQARSGVDQGYKDAYNLLDGLGAFRFEGVEDGVKRTKELIDEKLGGAEDRLREALGLERSVEAQATSASANAFVAQAGGTIAVVA